MPLFMALTAKQHPRQSDVTLAKASQSMLLVAAVDRGTPMSRTGIPPPVGSSSRPTHRLVSAALSLWLPLSAHHGYWRLTTPSCSERTSIWVRERTPSLSPMWLRYCLTDPSETYIFRAMS